MMTLFCHKKFINDFKKANLSKTMVKNILYHKLDWKYTL